MDDLRQAAEMALEALEKQHTWMVANDGMFQIPSRKAIQALRQALDKPEIDPKVLVDMAVLAEREACAKLCEKMEWPHGYECAAAIRARDEK